MSAREGRVVLVTGGAAGIGAAIVEKLARDGDRVVVVDILEALKSRWEPLPTRRTSVTPRALTGSSDGSSRRRPIGCAGELRGIFPWSSVLDLQLKDWREVIAVDLEAPVFLVQAVARRMNLRGTGGRVVNVSSIHGRYGTSTGIAYETAKGGLDNATRSLAVDLAPHGILVNAVAPGFVVTERNTPRGDPTFEAWYIAERRLPLGRPALPSEIAELVAWLASDANTYVTGEVIRIDGGLGATF